MKLGKFIIPIVVALVVLTYLSFFTYPDYVDGSLYFVKNIVLELQLHLLIYDILNNVTLQTPPY